MNTDPAISFRLISRPALLPADKARMFDLLSRHFEGVTPEQFARDLAEKNLALLLEREGDLVGFSSLLAYTTQFEGVDTNIIYSGDTIVTPEAWGSTALPRAWVSGVETLRAQLPPGRCFWLLLTSGFRTYRFLPVFWHEFFPRFNQVTPENMQRLLIQISKERFGMQFDSTTGIVRFRYPQKLCGGLKEVAVGRERDPHVSFFLSRNAGHLNGDELVCLTEVCLENLTRAGRRMMTHQTHVA